MKKSMKNLNIILASMALCISVLSAGCSDSSNKNNSPGAGTKSTPTVSIANAHPGAGRIVVLGDSLAAGHKATVDDVKPAGCMKQFPNEFIADLAVPGLTSEEITAKLRIVEGTHPKLIFVSSGGNDTMLDHKQPGAYPENKTLNEMNDMFDFLLQTGAVVAYLSVNPPVPYAGRMSAITQMAQSKGIIIVDGMNGFWQNPNLMADTIHPNDAGYKIMCDRTIEAIKGYYP